MPAPLDQLEKLRRRNIGRRLRDARLRFGWSQELVSYKLGAEGGDGDRRIVAKIEAGKFPLSDRLLALLTHTVGLDPDHLARPYSGFLPPGARIASETSDSHIDRAALLRARQSMIETAESRLTESCSAKRVGPHPCFIRWIPRSVDLQREVEKNADVIREKWRLGEAPIANLAYCLEREWFTLASLDHPIPFAESTVVAGTVSSWPVICWCGPKPGNPCENAEFRFRMLASLTMMFALKQGFPKTDARVRAEKLARALLLPASAATDALGPRCAHTTVHRIQTLASSLSDLDHRRRL